VGYEMNKFLIIGGIIEISLAFVCLFFGVLGTSIFLIEGYRYHDYRFQLQNAAGIFGLIAFAFGFTGGILAFKGKYFLLAVFGTVVIMVWDILFANLAMQTTSSYDRLTGVMFALFVFIFAIISMVFIVISKKEKG
jgi:hypothetical protein